MVSFIKTRISAIAVIADRTACSILTLYSLWSQHLDLWIKKNLFAVSPRIQELLRICIRNPQSAQLCLHLQCSWQQGLCTGLGRRSHRVTVQQRHRVIVTNEPTPSLSPIYTVMAFLARVSSFFVVHFVAKRYILQQKCQKGQIGTCVLGTRWNNF